MPLIGSKCSVSCRAVKEWGVGKKQGDGQHLYSLPQTEEFNLVTYGDFFICWHHRHFLSSPTPPPGSKLFCFFLPLALRVFQTSNNWLKISRDDCYAGYWHDVRQPSYRRSDTRLNTSSNLDFESVLSAELINLCCC